MHRHYNLSLIPSVEQLSPPQKFSLHLELQRRREEHEGERAMEDGERTHKTRGTCPAFVLWLFDVILLFSWSSPFITLSSPFSFLYFLYICFVFLSVPITLYIIVSVCFCCSLHSQSHMSNGFECSWFGTGFVGASWDGYVTCICPFWCNKTWIKSSIWQFFKLTSRILSFACLRYSLRYCNLR